MRIRYFWLWPACLLTGCLPDCTDETTAPAWLVNDTNGTVTVDVGSLWTDGQPLCDVRLEQADLLKEGDFSQRHRFSVPPNGIVALDCGPVLLKAGQVVAAFALAEASPRTLAATDGSEALLRDEDRSDPEGLIFFRCSDGTGVCRFEVGEGPAQLKLLPDAHVPRPSSCYPGQPRAYAQLSTLWPYGELMSLTSDGQGCLKLEMESRPVPRLPDPDPPLDASFPDDQEGDGGADGADSGVPVEKEDAGAVLIEPDSDELPFLPIAHSHRVCMDESAFPFEVGDLLRVKSRELFNPRALLRFYASRSGQPPNLVDPQLARDFRQVLPDSRCPPVRFACGAIVQPLTAQVSFGRREQLQVGQSHDVLLPGSDCGASMDRIGRWVEWIGIW